MTDSDDETLLLHRPAFTSGFSAYPYGYGFSPYYAPPYDMLVSKPKNGIFNAYMAIGAIFAGAVAIIMEAGIAPVIGSIIVGGLLMGMVGESAMNHHYKIALKQKEERKKTLGIGQEIGIQKDIQQNPPIYKNIPDLPAMHERERESQQAQFEEAEKRRKGNDAAAAYTTLHSMGSM